VFRIERLKLQLRIEQNTPDRHLESELARLRAEGVVMRTDVVAGPGGSQALLVDPSGNLVELFQPA